MLVLLLLTLVLVFLGGSLASDVFGAIGLGDTAASIWKIVRWPAAVCSMMVLYAVLYYAAPNVEVRRFQLITPGAVFGVVTWIVASVGFFVYVSNFSSYGATYGAFAGAVILLVWLWLSGVRDAAGRRAQRRDRPAPHAGVLRRPTTGRRCRRRCRRTTSGREAPSRRGDDPQVALGWARARSATWCRVLTLPV